MCELSANGGGGVRTERRKDSLVKTLSQSHPQLDTEDIAKSR